MERPLRVFVVAGEASGDHLGAGLMRALKEKSPNVEFYGVGGLRMAEAGLTSLFPMQDLSVMGLLEVLPRLFRILGRLRQTVRAVVRLRPDVLITIDSPDFCFRVVRRVRAKTASIPCIHYVAPSVWAWRPKRAEKVARLYDHLLALLPFEPRYFVVHGLATTFVGHPVVERAAQRGDAGRFARRHGLSLGQPVLCVLPGSRKGEIAALLDVFRAAVEGVLKARPDTVIVLPTLPHLRRGLVDYFSGRGINPIVVDGEGDRYDAFAAATAAMAASGTVSLELAVHDTPHIVAYRLNAFSAALARRLLTTPFVNLVNILLNRRAVPELLQDACTPEHIAENVLRLMSHTDARATQLMDFREALIRLGLGDVRTPSQKAAEAVLNLLHARRGGPGPVMLQHEDPDGA